MTPDRPVSLVTFYLTFDHGRKVMVNPMDIASVVEMRQGSMIVMRDGTKFEVTDRLVDIERRCLGVAR